MSVRHLLLGSLAFLLLSAAVAVVGGAYVWTGISSFNPLLRETGGKELSPAGALLAVSPRNGASDPAIPEMPAASTDAGLNGLAAPDADVVAATTPWASLGFVKTEDGPKRIRALHAPVDMALTQLDEPLLLGKDGVGTLRPVVKKLRDYAGDRVPLVLVHGINGQPGDLQGIAEGLDSERVQLYVWCYDDFHRSTSTNGRELADELQRLLRHTGAAELELVAHSMGGLVARVALNVLEDRGVLSKLSSVQFVAIDSPWHGFGGPSDDGVQRLFFAFSKPFLPDGLEDMRAGSAMFRGRADGLDEVARKGIFGIKLPSSVQVQLAFAEQGGAVMDVEESGLVDLLWVAYRAGQAPVLTKAQENQLFALRQGPAFGELEQQWQALGPELSRARVSSGIRSLYPSFPGDHTGVLSDPGLVEFLRQTLAPP